MGIGLIGIHLMSISSAIDRNTEAVEKTYTVEALNLMQERCRDKNKQWKIYEDEFIICEVKQYLPINE